MKYILLLILASCAHNLTQIQPESTKNCPVVEDSPIKESKEQLINKLKRAHEIIKNIDRCATFRIDTSYCIGPNEIQEFQSSTNY